MKLSVLLDFAFVFFSIFKNVKETNKKEAKKNFKKIYKKNHAKEKLGSPQIHRKKKNLKKFFWLRWELNPQTSDQKSSALPTKPSGMR